MQALFLSSIIINKKSVNGEDERMYEDLLKAYEVLDLPAIYFGGIMVDNQLLPSAPVLLLLKQFNRHGLVAGSTGSGKTKSLQVLAEQLSLAGVPSLLMDVKGDVSGLAMPGKSNSAIEERANALGINFQARHFPVELFSLSQTIRGLPIRGTVGDFGALLFSRLLELNDTQSGIMTILFEYAKDKDLKLIDLKDIQELLKFSQTTQGQSEIEKQYGRISSASISSIMRRIIEIEAQEGEYFFGEPAFDVHDLIRHDDKEQGFISVLRLMDMQDKPFLFSTFMIKLLSDIYRQLPECGDLDKPKLVIFIDEAHLIFKNANKPLLNLLDTIVKLIRSKGVGLVFCTQTPKDVPENILSQLGFKIQHALRAFTAQDRKSIELAAKNFPSSTYYKTEELLTSLGIGQALVTAIDAKGIPTPLVQCLIRSPQSRMGVLEMNEEIQLVQQSPLFSKYNQRLETESASERLNQITASEPILNKASVEEISFLEKMSKNVLVRQVARDLFKKLTQVTIALLKKK